MDFVELDAQDPDPDVLAGWVRCRVDAMRTDQPDDPAPSPLMIRGLLRDDAFGHHRTWVARSQGEVLGGMRLAFAWGDNEHSCDVDLVVHPTCRRRGIGRQLLDRARSSARAAGRRMMTAESETGEEFARAMGADLAQTVLRSLLIVNEAAVPGDGPPRGYELVRWMRSAPDEFLELAAAVKQAMADAPMGDLDLHPWTWSVQRMRAWEQAQVNCNRSLYTIAARHLATGELAGLSEVTVQDDDPMRAEQDDTVVVPAHRGHGLGMVMKAEMLRWLREIRPEVREIETWNADDNGHMLAINRALGYRVVGYENGWQLAL